MIDRVKGPLTSISLCSTSFFPSSSPAISAFFPAHYSHAKDYFRMGERQLSQKIANYTLIKCLKVSGNTRVFVFVLFVDQVMSSHHSDQLSQKSQVSGGVFRNIFCWSGLVTLSH